MKITVTIDTDNAAFDEHGKSEVAYLLDKAGHLVRLHGLDGLPDTIDLLDRNGNPVGTLDVER